MFRLVNCTKNINNIHSRTILTSFPANHSCFFDTALNHLCYQSKFWSAGINPGGAGISLGSAGMNLSGAGINLGDSGINLGGDGINLGGAGIKLRSAGTNLGIAGIKLGNAGTILRIAGVEHSRNECFFKKFTPVFN